MSKELDINEILFRHTRGSIEGEEAYEFVGEEIKAAFKEAFEKYTEIVIKNAKLKDKRIESYGEIDEVKVLDKKSIRSCLKLVKY